MGGTSSNSNVNTIKYYDDIQSSTRSKFTGVLSTVNNMKTNNWNCYIEILRVFHVGPDIYLKLEHNGKILSFVNSTDNVFKDGKFYPFKSSSLNMDLDKIGDNKLCLYLVENNNSLLLWSASGTITKTIEFIVQHYNDSYNVVILE